MNQTFSISRFGRLLRTYFIDHRGQLLANLALLIGGLFVLGLFFYQGFPGGVRQERVGLFFIVGWPAWYVFTVQQTAVLNQKERAMNYLMQPASQFEKIVLVWLVSGVGFIIVYVLVFALLDTVGISYVNNRDWTPDQLATMRLQGSFFHLGSFFSENSLHYIPAQLWVFSALLHPFTLVFSLLIRRYTLPIAVVIAFGLLIVSYLANNLLLRTLTGTDLISSISPFARASADSPLTAYQHRYHYRVVNLPQPIGDLIRYGVGIVGVVLLYVTAYYRLKEREV